MLKSYVRSAFAFGFALLPIGAAASDSQESPTLGQVEVICVVKWSQEATVLSTTSTAQPPFTVTAQFQGYTGGPAQNFNWVMAYKACSANIAAKAQQMCSAYATAPNKVIYQVTLALSNANGNQMKFSQTYACEQKEAQLENENPSNDN